MARVHDMSEDGRARKDAPDWSVVALSRDEFVSKVRQKGEELYRELPWRHVDDAYGVFVSEVMLQQTQVARVMNYWDRWMALFPTADALAASDTALVLEMWQGLGYNRRALALKRACEKCSLEYGGVLPRTEDELISLPGIGPATAAGIMAFAYQQPAVYIETNVRSVFLHELFPNAEGVSDKELIPYVRDVCPVAVDDASVQVFGPREWYYALLDYGADLKKRVSNPSRRSAHHTRQSKFSGSHREKRSVVLRLVLAAPEGVGRAEIRAALDAYEHDAGRSFVDAQTFESLIEELVQEGFFRIQGDMLVP